MNHLITDHISYIDLNQCQRLFHGRGHAFKGLSHVNVDWFSPVILITLYRPVEQNWLELQLEQLKAKFSQCHSIQVQHRYLARPVIECVWGEDIQQLIAVENGLSYGISFAQSQNVGLFLDMANGRHWVKQQCRDKNVLNLFAYTCAFSIAAMAGGARQVVNIDMAKGALSKGRENHRINQQELTQVKFEAVDIFKSYSRLKKYGPYEVMICDPPSFQKGSVNIARDYKKIIKRIPELMAANGALLLCLNSPDLDEEFLLTEVARECPDCIFIEKIANPEVFKEAEQGKGLKVLRFVFQPLHH
jgi:23S rRNA (cytosine1962-C5)-methyltransferase